MTPSPVKRKRVVRIANSSLPLCRLVCFPSGKEHEWAWEACESSAASATSFTSLYQCAENARQSGFEVDLLRAPLVTGPTEARKAG